MHQSDFQESSGSVPGTSRGKNGGGQPGLTRLLTRPPTSTSSRLPRSRSSTRLKVKSISSAERPPRCVPLWIPVRPNSIVPAQLVPDVQTRPSRRSSRGVEYVAADGGSMPNTRRTTRPSVLAQHAGHRCEEPPLACCSDVRRWARGHIPLDGGSTVGLGTGQETKLHRVGNVYRLQVNVRDED